MKKGVSILMASAVFALSLTGCGKKQEESAQQPSVTITPGKLVVSTESGYPPYEYRNEKNEIVGVDVDIMKNVAKKLNAELEYIDMEFQQAILAAQNGQSDLVAAALVVTEERKKGLDFSESYKSGANVIMTKKGSGIQEEKDLVGKIIGVQTGTVGDDFATASKEKGQAKEVRGYKAFAQAIIDLSNDKIDCIIISDTAGKKLMGKNEGLELTGPVLYSSTAIGAKKGNAELIKVVNEVLAEMKESGELDKSYEFHNNA